MTNKAIDHNPENGEQHTNNEVSILNNIFNPQGKSVVFNNPSISMPQGIETTSISYKNNYLVELNVWDGKAHSISIFGTIDFLNIDTKNISTSLLQMANFINNRKLNKNKNLLQLKGFD